MSWFCSACEKSFSRKDSMQRHVMSKHRNVVLTIILNSSSVFTEMSAVSLRASFHLHDCRNDWVRKNGLGSIAIATILRDHSPSPGEDRLVLFTMAASVYTNVNRHAKH